MTEHENSGSICWFQNLCKENLNSAYPDNRYVCVDRIIESIKAKKGRYSNSDRVAWMIILYVCLTGPDFYFAKSLSRYKAKKERKYADQLNNFANQLEFELVHNSSICAYLDCVRDYSKKLPYKITDHHPMAGDLRERILAMLEKRKCKYPKLRVTIEEYKKVLDKIFKEEDGRLNHPTFFLFLPYYLFIELAKCEKLISADVNAFAIPQLNTDTMSWTIRNSPLRIFNTSEGAECIERLADLYERIERTLCKGILKKGFPSIGESTLQAIWACPEDPLMARLYSPSSIRKTGYIEPQELNEENEYQELERLEERVELEELRELGELDELDALYEEEDLRSSQIAAAIPFSVPFWKYSEWALCFHSVFQVELSEISEDIHRLFCLSFRPSTRQAQKEMTEIRGRYLNHQMRSRKQVFCLADLMDALCTIYNPAMFQAINPFDDLKLKNTVNMLTDFMAAINYQDYSNNDTIQQRWIDLLRYGYPPANEWDPCNNSDGFLINPSRVLVQAIFVRTVAEKWGGNVWGHKKVQQYFRDAVFYGPEGRFDTSMAMAQQAIHSELNSTKMILQDMATWGGIKVIEGKKALPGSLCRWADAMRIWEFWHQERFPIYTQISLYIQNHPAYLDSIVNKLPEVCTKPVKLDLQHIEIGEMVDSTKTKKLLPRKREIVSLVDSFLPTHLQDALGSPDELDDFQYTILLYIVFSALKKRMCTKVYEQYMKLLQLP